MKDIFKDLNFSGESLAEIAHISDDRGDELAQKLAPLLRRFFNDDGMGMADVLKGIGEIAENPGEIAMLCFSFGAACQKMKMVEREEEAEEIDGENFPADMPEEVKNEIRKMRAKGEKNIKVKAMQHEWKGFENFYNFLKTNKDNTIVL